MELLDADEAEEELAQPNAPKRHKMQNTEPLPSFDTADSSMQLVPVVERAEVHGGGEELVENGAALDREQNVPLEQAADQQEHGRGDGVLGLFANLDGKFDNFAFPG